MNVGRESGKATRTGADQGQVPQGLMKSNCACRPLPTAFVRKDGSFAGISNPDVAWLRTFSINWPFSAGIRPLAVHGFIKP